MNITHRSIGTAALLALSIGVAHASSVYTLSNETNGNAVLQFEQADDGSLSLAARYPTGGLGTGGGLGNQGAIAAGDDFLYAVDPGSNEISVFRFDGDSLVLTDRSSSFGSTPVSVTVDRELVYVVNAGSDSIAGFRVSVGGEIEPIAGSVQPLSQVGTAPAQISFSKDGRQLIVTEKATQRILTFGIGDDGIAGGVQVFDSPGATPFGFTVISGRRVLVSEAAGGAANASSVTAWKLSPQGELSVLDPVVGTRQSAACWVAVTPNGQFAFTTNTASGTVSSYRVRGDRLLLQDEDGIAADFGAGTAPVDMAVSHDGRYLYTLNVGSDEIVTLEVANDGSLARIATTGGLPDRATGLLFH